MLVSERNSSIHSTSSLPYPTSKLRFAGPLIFHAFRKPILAVEQRWPGVELAPEPQVISDLWEVPNNFVEHFFLQLNDLVKNHTPQNAFLKFL